MCIIGSTKFNYSTLNWNPGTHFGPEEYHKVYDWKVETIKSHIITEPISHFVHCLEATTIAVFIIFWYFDHILSSNRGVAYSLYFPF
jgi:hypothetical protein